MNLSSFAMDHISEPGPGQLQIRSGGGCVSLFGIPFLSAGVAVLLIGLGFISPSNADEMPFWGWPLLVIFGLVFAGVGSGLVFGRQWILIDRHRGIVRTSWGLLRPLRAREQPLSLFSTVAITHDPGDSDSAETFPVTLSGPGGSPTVVLSQAREYGEARVLAEAVARVMQIPALDRTTEHESSIHAEGEKPRAARDAETGAHRPFDARTTVRHEAGNVVIEFPPAGLTPAVVIQAVFLTGFTAFILFQFGGLFDIPQVPDAAAGLMMLGLLLILALPLLLAAYSIVKAMWSTTVVKAGSDGVVIADVLLFTRVRHAMTREDILGIDYSTSGRRMEAMKMGSVAPEGVVQRGVGWIVAHARRSGGVTLKTRKGMVEFGSGLSDEEVKYLYGVVRDACDMR